MSSKVSSRGRPRQFQVTVFLLLPKTLRSMALAFMYEGHACHSGTASEESASKTDEKPTRESVGLMGQVASCRPFPPSSRDEVTERPGWQPRGLPDLSNFH
jgi:hypothetical protein